MLCQINIYETYTIINTNQPSTPEYPYPIYNLLFPTFHFLSVYSFNIISCKCNHNTAFFYPKYLFYIHPGYCVYLSFIAFLPIFLPFTSKHHISFMFFPTHLYGKIMLSPL